MNTQLRHIASILIFIASFVGSGAAWAVDCPQASFYLQTQAAVDAFPQDCDTVTNINVAGNSDDITNLDSLSKITQIRDFLQIESNSALTNIDGLVNLRSVGGFLIIQYNDSLRNIGGLSNLYSIRGYLYINQNPTLQDLAGLAQLTSVGRDLDITYNQQLANLDGLNSLTSVGGDLRSLNNVVLTNLDGLANLSSVGGDLVIQQSNLITNLDGLANLTSVGGNLGIYANDLLTNCRGVAPVLGWPSGPPDDSVGGIITISSNGGNECDSVSAVLASVSGPSQPVINTATGGNESISLGFSPSTTASALFPITGYEAACTGSTANVSEAPNTPLLDNKPIQRTLTVNGYDPTSVAALIEVPIDITHSDPTDLVITLTSPAGTVLTLWNRGSSGGENLVGTFPTTLNPVDSLSSIAQESMDGDWVLTVEDVDAGPIVREGVLNSWGVNLTEQPKANSSDSPVTVGGLTNGRQYSCTVAPVINLGTAPLSNAVSATPVPGIPSTPQITNTDYGNEEIYLSVTVSNNGGSTISTYTAICTDGTTDYTGTSSTSRITVSGLTNEVGYSCSVTATNAAGTSTPSASSPPITPEYIPTGLPIWLLYEASK